MKYANRKPLKSVVANRAQKTPHLTDQAYLTEREVATRLNVSVKWMQKMRFIGGGIPFAKFGGAVRYPVAEVLHFEERSLCRNTAKIG